MALYDGNGVFKDENILPLDKTIFVANKMDSFSASQIQTVKDKRHLLISAKYNQGIDELIAVLLEKMENLAEFSLDKEIELSAEDIRLACRAIGRITGVVQIDEILDNIFGSFCIGK